MRQYDLTVLVNTSTGEDAAKEIETKLNDIIGKKGRIFKSVFNGRLDLSETFKKHTQAYSIRIQYEGDNSTLDALSKEFTINESIIRHTNFLLSNIMDQDKVTKVIG